MARIIDERGRKYMEKVESSELGKIIRGLFKISMPEDGFVAGWCKKNLLLYIKIIVIIFA